MQRLRSQAWFGGLGRDAFLHRSWMKNEGHPDDEFDGRPVIGICNTFSELTPCNAHFRQLAEYVKRGVREAGGRLVPLSEATLARERSNIGMVFQRFNLFPHLTAVGNVMIGLTEVRGKSPTEARDIAKNMLDRVGLAERAKYFPGELSGGQQQRVAIARALVMNPKAMLFDEPTSALDPELVGGILSIMEELANEGMTMVVVTHEVGFARRVADRVIMMDGGLIIEDAPPTEFFESPQQERTRKFLEAVQ